ncbi:hypothetical protein [Halodesulfovibrio sp.]|uniref:hypothetical protein n=1 Tax=Halodesulfovibrio sp. TaxID=1912772 RepID=UPI0025DCF6C3|nr:hypothetical protein [Halodesulfovibrio sp.]MCT4534288.1 hypothetical protein [Halodesulfovibrio sp.]MCT4627099.1 hypothetical protein [Halodesulfovibrio sp.]
MHNSKRLWTTVIAVVLVVMAVGCVKVRREPTFARTSSSVAHTEYVAVDDWGVWASEVADKVEKAVNDRPDIAGKPIYMRPLNGRAFATGFYSLLSTELISRGLQVAVLQEEDMVVLSYATLPVSSENEKTYVAMESGLIGGSKAGGEIAAKGDFERYDMWDESEKRAIILSIGLSYNNRYVMHTSSILSVAEEERGNFVSPYERGYKVKEFPARNIKVRGE